MAESCSLMEVGMFPRWREQCTLLDPGMELVQIDACGTEGKEAD